MAWHGTRWSIIICGFLELQKSEDNPLSLFVTTIQSSTTFHLQHHNPTKCRFTTTAQPVHRLNVYAYHAAHVLTDKLWVLLSSLAD